MKAFMSQTYFERCEAWPSRAEQEARAILAESEPSHVEPVRLYQYRGATLPRGWCMGGAAFDALAEALAAFVADDDDDTPADDGYVYTVRVMADQFPPHRQVAGLTDTEFASFAEARAAVKIEFPRAKSRPVRDGAEAQVARYRVADGEVTIETDAR